MNEELSISLASEMVAAIKSRVDAGPMPPRVKFYVPLSGSGCAKRKNIRNGSRRSARRSRHLWMIRGQI
jgi:hypothetical protein